MTYAVKEIFLTLQGEGTHTGRPAVFLRFSGCNLWTGREQDRATAICRFCDTDFFATDGTEGGKYRSAAALADKVASLWPVASTADRYVVCTGGEPLLQLDEPLIAALHERGFEVGVETNGTIAAPAGLDWICVSPKIGAPLRQRTGHEIKLVYPQEGGDPAQFEGLDFGRWYLQPMDGPNRDEHTRLVIAYCLAHPRWRLSLQTHKTVGIR
jgi:7-carboxy-7-deazaguanine synthase (Cx14CxxC type)